MNALTQYLDLYRDHAEEVMRHAPEVMNRPRPEAFEALMGSSLPQKGDENFPVLDVEKMFAPDYGVNINRVPFAANPADSFHCGVPNISTLLAMIVNDGFVATASLLRNLPKGVTVTSLAKAAHDDPEWIAEYYNRLPGRFANASDRVVTNLNTLLAQDGLLIRVASGVRLEKPLQIVNVFNASMPLMGVRRVLVVLEPDAAASLLSCDHSVNQNMEYLSNQVIEVYLHRGARLEYYDLEESSEHTARYSVLYAAQEEDSQLVVNGTTLIGHRTRNAYYIDQQGEHTETHLAGMAISSATQIVDNATLVRHNCPKGESNQMFKYILEDQSKASFYGTIIVDEKARFTKAYQSNRNVLMGKEARMYTRPQLEIYCDEVKCSHGAATGQLDANALFYMRQRGIPEAEAKMMLMQAFMADVIETVRIPALKSRLHQLVELRLSGTRELCAGCAAAE